MFSTQPCDAFKCEKAARIKSSGGADVDGHHLVEKRGVGGVQIIASDGCGVIHQSIQPAERLYRRGDDFWRRGWVC